MSNRPHYWYQDEDGSYYDWEFQLGPLYKEYVNEHPDLDYRYDPTDWTHIHNTKGTFRFETNMITDPYDTYIKIYNDYRTLSNKPNRTEDENELVGRQRKVLSEISSSFNSLHFAKSNIPIMKIDKNTYEMMNEDEVLNVVRYYRFMTQIKY